MSTATDTAPSVTHLSASVVEKYTPEGAREEQSYWTEVGRAFVHNDGKGYNLNVRPGLSLSGTVVLNAPKPDAGAAAQTFAACHKARHLEAFVVEKYTVEGSEKEQSHWTDVGRAFPHKNGAGFNLVIRPGLAVYGSIVLRTPKPADEQGSETGSFR